MQPLDRPLCAINPHPTLPPNVELHNYTAIRLRVRDKSCYQSRNSRRQGIFIHTLLKAIRYQSVPARMIAKVAIAALVLVMCLGAPVRAQFPAGLFDDVERVANMPGAVTSTAISISGQTPYTATTGTGNGGSAMASATSSGHGGTKTSTTVNGVTKTSVNAAGSSCTAVSSSNGQVCDGFNKACCSINSDVKRCKSHVSARATINGNTGLCCITLFRQKDNSPALWCAGPSSTAYYSLPSSAQVQLKPSCMNYSNSKVGSLACVVGLPILPSGFVAPRGYTSKKPLAYNKGTGFSPCMGSSFSRVIQVDTIKDNKLFITSKCE